MNFFTDTLPNRDLSQPTTLLFYVLCFCVLCLVGGVFGFYITRDKSLARMRLLSAGKDTQTQVLRTRDVTPSGWKKALIPDDPSERAQIQFQLAKVGFDHEGAVEIFFLFRLVAALFMPVLIGLVLLLANAGLLPLGLMERVQATSPLTFVQIGGVFGAVGFYGPGYWLKGRIKARQLKIRHSFPNAMDLLQISVESGLGFDAALIRVGDALEQVSPEISYEFRLVRQEVQAGADREAALFEMANRMGIEEAKSFALVIAQSLQFGTSLTSALKNYAIEMRTNRELAAQEKANKLPVQMSAVMSFLMLPALFLITLTPIIIRYASIY